MALCQATKANGTPCQVKATASGFCWAHDPANAERRKQIARQGNRAGGKGRPSPARDELTEIRQLLRGLTAKVYKEEITPAIVYAIATLCNGRLRVVELERKIAEHEDLEARIAALEQAAPAQGGKRWG
jgi:hypothetical protein